MSTIVIYDTEYTSWEGAQDRDWDGPGEFRQVIQIAAIKAEWPSGKIIDTFNILVKPELNPVLSDYITQLTGITQDDVDSKGITFEEALYLFLMFCGANGKTLSYGGDEMVLAENVMLTRCEPHNLFGCYAPHFIDISLFIRAAEPALTTNGRTSGELWEHFGLPRPGGFGAHDAIFDCASILAAMVHLNEQGRLPLLNL